MRKSGILILFFVFQFSLGCFAQIGVGQWRDHLPFTFEKHITQSSNKIFAATDYGVLIYSKSTKNIEKLTKVNGLSDVGISALAYSTENNVLFVGYSNGNIDLIKGKDIFNMSDIKRKIITGSKSINNVIFIDEFAIISCGFGVVVLNLEKQEIKDTYFIGNFGGLLNINQLAFDGQYLYAATSQGIYKGDYLYANLADFNNWILQTSIPNYSGNFNAVINLEGKILANYSVSGSNDITYILNNGIWSVFSSDFDEIRKINYSNNRLLLAANKRLIMYDQNLIFVDSIQTSDYTNPNISDALIDNNNTIWITDLGNGLIKHAGTNFEFIFPNAPYTSDVFSFDIKNKRVLVAGGGIGQTGSNVFINGTVHSFQNQQWRSLINYNIADIVNVIIDPTNTNHFYAGSWGYGLLEFSNNELVETFNTENSSLQSMIPGENYIRIGGVAFDEDNNLWITNSGVANIISVKKANGEWKGYNYDDVISNERVSDIIVAQNKNKWVVLPTGLGLFVFNENNTLDNTTDDSYKRISIIDENGKLITNNVYSIAEDLKGVIWVGTDQGVVVYYNPENVFESDNFYAQRIILTINGISQYLLKTEVVTSIAVDGANRKWIGTNSSGVYLVSKDGTEELNHFTEDNSPLLSNRILDIGIDHESGEVYFATEKGLISYRGNATMGSDEFRDVYVYPNPVREDYEGDITIRGLVSDVNVKITDISGNLVYETTAEGGQATWNGKNFSGRRVSTGIYLVFCTNDDGSKTYITKLLFIK
jgi:sugar lactone lactonase YvrE